MRPRCPFFLEPCSGIGFCKPGWSNVVGSIKTSFSYIGTTSLCLFEVQKTCLLADASSIFTLGTLAARLLDLKMPRSEKTDFWTWLQFTFLKPSLERSHLAEISRETHFGNTPICYRNCVFGLSSWTKFKKFWPFLGIKERLRFWADQNIASSFFLFIGLKIASYGGGWEVGSL